MIVVVEYPIVIILLHCQTGQADLLPVNKGQDTFAADIYQTYRKPFRVICLIEKSNLNSLEFLP